VSGSVVRWNGAGRTTSFTSSTQLTAAIAAADIATPGTAQVTVANPAGAVSNALTFTIPAASTTCPCSIWTPSQTPLNAAENDPAAVEIGTRFRTDVAGYISAIRFFKNSANLGPFVGHLWSGSGTLLATVPIGLHGTAVIQLAALVLVLVLSVTARRGSSTSRA